MTVYSCVCVYLGSITRAAIMVVSAIHGPCIGLLILAITCPFVHSKGAGTATLITFAIQLFLMWQRISSGHKPPHMPVNLDYCLENSSSFNHKKNVTLLSMQHRSQDSTVFFQISPLWSCLFSTVATVVLGILLSCATGENRQRRADSSLLNSWFVKIWTKLGIMECDEQKVKADAGDNVATKEALLKKDDDAQQATSV
ncbi:sodium-coupled monocarboxylate transporter 1-like [Dermacentor variabilis]|uniref:sodium-coupled monocarboxylate transporter 1-like n=1 Tax=Dermacentor variabilis TaxID=34621 RepID=UPI003F5C6BC6